MCKKCICRYHVDKSRFLKKRCIDYCGGKCKTCGYSSCIQALDFHHIDPSLKDFNISKKMKDLINFDEMKKELDKCVLLCCRCHREAHLIEHVQLFSDEEIQTLISSKKRRRGTLLAIKRECLTCKKSFCKSAEANPIFCGKKCADIAKLSPCPEEIAFRKIADKCGIKQAAREFNTTDRIVKRWAKELNYDYDLWKARSFKNREEKRTKILKGIL